MGLRHGPNSQQPLLVRDLLAGVPPSSAFEDIYRRSHQQLEAVNTLGLREYLPAMEQ